MKKILLVVLGPTGIGKSKLAIKLAEKLNTEIISADSRKIYKELVIGTAVPDKILLKKIPHHLIHSHSIHDYFNASKFENIAIEIINNLFQTKDYVIMAGGSMLYIDAVCYGIDDLPAVDLNIREQLINDYNENGIEHIRMQLKKLDPLYYSRVDMKNPKRILHALEVCLTSGKPYSFFMTEKVKERPFQIIKAGLNCKRENLYERINERVDKMISSGLEQEARSVFPFRNLNSLNTVGYRELFSYFDGEISLEKAIELIKRNTRHYAKKQLNWFKKDKSIKWFQPEEEEEIMLWIDKLQNQ